MKYLPTWLKTVFYLSFYPLVLCMYYCIQGALYGHKDLIDVIFKQAPATGWAGFKESLEVFVFVVICIPTLLIAVILCVIIHLYTYVQIGNGCSCKCEVETSKGARRTITALLIISAVCFFGTLVIANA